MRVYLFNETIWPSIHAAIEYMQIQRRGDLSLPVRAGINFSIILGSACYVEGVLETGLKALLQLRRVIYNRIEMPELQLRRSNNAFYKRLEEDVRLRIISATGVAGYQHEVFELLVGQRLKALTHVVPMWEGLSALFHLRNVLGHGREVTARQILKTPIEEQFSGGYRKAEDYLRKHKLLGKKFTEAHSKYLYLTNGVADHFLANCAAASTSNSRFALR